MGGCTSWARPPQSIFQGFLVWIATTAGCSSRSCGRTTLIFDLHLLGFAPRLVLQLEQLEVDPALREQLLVRPRLAQLTLVQDEDLVHVLDRRQAMRNRDGRALGH